MGCSIIAISKIVACNACIVVVYPGFITDKNLCHDCIDAIATFFQKTLARDHKLFSKADPIIRFAQITLLIQLKSASRRIWPVVYGQSCYQPPSPIAQ
jgi:hypothetical protein